MNTDKITQSLKDNFWYGGRATYPWNHPANKVPNCLMIHLDGSPVMKFQVHKNGRLRLRVIYPWTRIDCFPKMKLKILQTIKADDLPKLLKKWANKKYSSAHFEAENQAKRR